MKNTISFLCLFACILSYTSCISSKEAVYFDHLGDTTFISAKAEARARIQTGDILGINVSSLNPEATILFNTPNTPGLLPSLSSGAAAGVATPIAGYLVDDDGNIKFPLLGNMKADGLTKRQLTEAITDSLVGKDLLVDPIVNIRFLNFKVTVLGEVARPMMVTVTDERISIFQAIGLAGDLTVYAQRHNVALIREEGGKKTVTRINLNSSEIFTSPFYYLKTNDVIYVEPNKSKIAAASSTRQSLPIILGSLAIIATILTRIL